MGSPFDIQGRGLTVVFRIITCSSFGGQTINSKYNQGYKGVFCLNATNSLMYLVLVLIQET